MLNKQENEVMKVVYNLSVGKESILVSPRDILNCLSEKSKINEEKLEKIINSLELDDYFDVILSDRKGEKIYCISLHVKGQAYPRSVIQVRRTIVFRFALVAGGAVISFIVGLILKSIF